MCVFVYVCVCVCVDVGVWMFLYVCIRAAKINQLIILTYCLKILIFYHTKILRYPKTIIIIVIITIYDKIKKVNDCYINLQLLLHHH